MKCFIFLIALITGTLAHANCPDFSGNYEGTYDFQDFREKEFIALTQQGCEQFTINGKMTFKNSSPNHTWVVTHKVSSLPGNGVWYWDNNELVFLQKNANSENCDIRDIFYQDLSQNLKVKWRFENCSNGYTSPWYINNIVNGTYHRQ